MQTTLGPITTADEVCTAVETTLRAWLPVALNAMQLTPELSPPDTYRQVPTVDALRTAAFPAIGISTPGWSEPPMRDEDGNLQLHWRVNVIAFIRGDDYEATQRNTRNYAAAIATVLDQQKTLLGFASATHVVGEGYEPLNDGARTIGGALIEVDVTVDDARNDLAVVDGDPAEVAAATGTVADVAIEVTREEQP